jgi:glycosyltransferase involved in cell wall biosynthesis
VPRVVVAHDWLVTYAGSERVVEALMATYPDAELMTAVIRRDRVPAVLAGAEPSFLQRVPGAADHHTWLLPALPLAWRLRRAVRDADVVISSSHSCAKAVRVADGIPHVCYCHTPMRYAWYFDAERHRLPSVLQPPAKLAMGAFRNWDASTARRVTRFVANSTAVADRIRAFYGRDSDVVHPPVRTTYFTPRSGARDGFLYVGRLVSYKRPDLVIDAFRGLPHRLTVVGSGSALAALRRDAPDNVTFVPSATDDELRELYRSSLALVYPGVEDFGIVMAEAQACGTPVVAAAAGGALDIVEPGATGWLVREPDVESIRAAVQEAADATLDSASIAASAERFSEERFRSEMREIVAGVLA